MEERSVYISLSWGTELASAASPFSSAGFKYYDWTSKAHAGLSHIDQHNAILEFMKGAKAYILCIPEECSSDMSASRMQIAIALVMLNLPVIVVDSLSGRRTPETHASLYSRDHTAVANYITRAFWYHPEKNPDGIFRIVTTMEEALALVSTM